MPRYESIIANSVENALEQVMKRYDDIASLAPARTALARALEASTAMKAKEQEVRIDSHLTDAGKRDCLRSHVAKEAHQVLRARKTLEKIKSIFEGRRAALLPTPSETTDARTAVIHSEMRAMLRSMSAGQRQALLMSDEADTTLLCAVLELPNFATGINDETRRLTEESYIRKVHAGEIEKMARISEGLDVLAAGTQALENAAISAGGFVGAHDLNDFLERSVGDTSGMDADIDRTIASVA